MLQEEAKAMRNLYAALERIVKALDDEDRIGQQEGNSIPRSMGLRMARKEAKALLIYHEAWKEQSR